VTEDATRRLDALTQTTDGFALAEVDVELRGEGTLFGVKQSGRNDLKLASILRDGNLIELAQQVATDFVVRAESDIELRQVIEAELSILEVRVDDSEGIFRS
jgi:ATP-dependent DNA helicase RecG